VLSHGYSTSIPILRAVPAMMRQAASLLPAFKSASLIGGHYELKSIKLEKDGANQKSFLVVVDRSDIRKIDKANHQSILWSASTIKNTFIVKRVGGVWLLSDTK
jgi:hypothetical protein